MDWHLKKWKEDLNRKPCLLRGARGVGKTFAVRELGKSFKQFVEVNFESNEEMRAIFEKDQQPDLIIRKLNLLLDVDILSEDTLLFFDEIQECPLAMKALPLFKEKIPSLRVIAAGSFLNFALEKFKSLLGKVESFYCYPLCFMEFLVAIGERLTAKAIIERKEGEVFSEVEHEKMLELVALYMAIGGMPEAVSCYVTSQSPRACFGVHSHINDIYRQDFVKYCKDHQIKHVKELYFKIPSQVGRQFKYSKVHKSYKKRELTPVLEALCLANIIQKIHHTTAQTLPLGSESKSEWFKAMFLDVALAQSILGLDLKSWLLYPKKEFRGREVFLENFVGGELLAYSNPYRKMELYYWRKEEKQAQAEVSFCVKFKEEIIPIEVKNGDGRTLKSLQRFLDLHPKSSYGIRFSLKEFSRLGQIVFKPLYDVVSLAHEEQKISLQALISLEACN